MTRKCPRCGEENLPEAKFCESCGYSMDAAEVQSGDTKKLAPRPGSLRDAIPFLTGGVDQAKARYDGWKQKKTRTDTQKLREAHFEEQRKDMEEAAQRESKPESFSQTVTRVVVGLLALALLIWLLLRNPNLPPGVAMRMVNQLVERDVF